MDVYYNGNGNIWGRGSQKHRLSPFPVGRSFLWGDQKILLPAVYVGREGAVLDICAEISTQEMSLFLKKWNRERRLSLSSQEDYEQIDADNPGSREFEINLRLNGVPLTRRMSSSMRWYPKGLLQDTEEDWENDPDAEKMMEACGCDRKSCWNFTRTVYLWKDEAVLSPREVSLLLKAEPVSVTAGHFTTTLNCGDREVEIIHPATREKYLLTLHGCEQVRHSFSEIGEPGMLYPEYSQTLLYSVSPEIDRSLLHIRDCAENDPPRATERSGDGPTAVFLAGRDPAPDRRIAHAALHFEPASEIRWRVIFSVKPREDMEIGFSV